MFLYPPPSNYLQWLQPAREVAKSLVQSTTARPSSAVSWFSADSVEVRTKCIYSQISNVHVCASISTCMMCTVRIRTQVFQTVTWRGCLPVTQHPTVRTVYAVSVKGVTCRGKYSGGYEAMHCNNSNLHHHRSHSPFAIRPKQSTDYESPIRHQGQGRPSAVGITEVLGSTYLDFVWTTCDT